MFSFQVDCHLLVTIVVSIWCNWIFKLLLFKALSNESCIPYFKQATFIITLITTMANNYKLKSVKRIDCIESDKQKNG